MAKIKTTDVSHIAKLANLNLNGKEKILLAKQLSQIVEYIEELQNVETKTIEPTSQTTGLENTTREDEVIKEKCLDQKDALAEAKNIHNGYFAVEYLLKERSIS